MRTQKADRLKYPSFPARSGFAPQTPNRINDHDVSSMNHSKTMEMNADSIPGECEFM